jgi:hypothetical protein
MHARLAEVFRSLAGFALVASRQLDDREEDADRRRRLISQQVTDVQGRG